MGKLITIILILVSSLAFSQETPTHISKLDKEYDIHKAQAWTSSWRILIYTFGVIAYEHRVNQMTPRTQQISMVTFGLVLNVKGIYHVIKAKKLKKKIYTQKYIINLYSYD